MVDPSYSRVEKRDMKCECGEAEHIAISTQIESINDDVDQFVKLRRHIDCNLLSGYSILSFCLGYQRDYLKLFTGLEISPLTHNLQDKLVREDKVGKVPSHLVYPASLP